MTDRLVWIDCEMTGLDLGSDALIEIAALVTDGDLNILGEGVDVVIACDYAKLDAMPDVVRDMHARSGLTEEVRRATVTVEQAEKMVLDYVRTHVPDARSAPLAGNSIATDRGFIARDMTELDGYLHYRMIDVSSVKELARRWFPGCSTPSRRRASRTARSPTSASRSASWPTTGRRCSWPRPVRRPSRRRPRRPPSPTSRHPRRPVRPRLRAPTDPGL